MLPCTPRFGVILLLKNDEDGIPLEIEKKLTCSSESGKTKCISRINSKVIERCCKIHTTKSIHFV